MKKNDSASLQAEFQTLVEVVARLRGPDGCPWDKEQNQQTLAPYAIEEAFELAEAIEKKDQPEIKEELGDFLFQVILQAQVAQDEGHFSLLEVIKKLNEKMIRRHPHVFGDVKADSTAEVWKNWDKLKSQESPKAKPVFSYPKNLPALQAAQKIGSKTKRLQFDWTEVSEVFAKVQEEISELQIELDSTPHSPQKLEHEIGDVLFSMAQLARHLNLEPEQCLRSANRRFEERFFRSSQALSSLD
ncbi:MAG: nucleoside triphosphate pyrophosphohydrolase [Pseudobdellovibrionaceae bacterium]